jgi:hypothetical protein
MALLCHNGLGRDEAPSNEQRSATTPGVTRAWLLVLLSLTGCNLVRGPKRDHECRSTLRQIMALEFGFQSQQFRYTTHPHEVGFAPGPGNRYLYLFDKVGEVTRRDDKPSPRPED